MFSPSAHPRMLFEKRELFVDDNEAPLPDPFDYSNHDGGPGPPLGEEELDPDGPSVRDFTDMVNLTEMCSLSAHPRILFKKWELFVDDNEAPLPDPFNYSDHDNRISPPPKGKEPDSEGRRYLCVAIVGLPDGVSVTDFTDMVNLTEVVGGVLLVTKSQGKGTPAHIIFNVFPVTARIIFEKRELEVDSNEAPLPEPFDLAKQCDNGEDSGYGKNQDENGELCLGKDSDVDVLEVGKHKETSGGGSIEVKNRKEKRNHEGTKRTGHTTDVEEGEQPRSKRMQQETVTGFASEREANEALKAEPGPRFVFENLSELGQVLPCLGWHGVGPRFRWGLGDVLCRAKDLNELGNNLGGPKYDRIGYEGNLQQAIDYAYSSSTIRHGIGFQIITFPNLMGYFISQYRRTGDIGDLHQSIEYGQQALFEPQSCDDRVKVLRNLGVSLGSRYERTGDIDDLHQAIEYNQQALAAIPQSCYDRVKVLCSLGIGLGSRYERTGDIDDLHQAIEYNQQALAAIPQLHSYRATILRNSSFYLETRYDHAGDIGDLHQAIECNQQALAAIPQPHPHRATILRNLSIELMRRYKRAEAIDDVHQAIKYTKQILAETPQSQDHTHRNTCLSDLGEYLSVQYEVTGAMDDLRQAIEYGQEALAATTRGRIHCLANLSGYLYSRYQRTGTMGDLNQAIEYTEQALAAISQGGTGQVRILNNLGLFLNSRYQRTGAIGDLHRAIEYTEQALVATPQGGTSQVCILNNLSLYLGARYKRTGSIKDLYQAIEYIVQALAATPEGDTNRGNYLGNMAEYLSTCYERTGAIDDIRQAIEYSKEALAATPQGHTGQPLRLSNLGLYLGIYYERTRDIDDLHQAIEYSKEALAAAPQGHTDQPLRLNNLSVFLNSRYQRTGAIDDLHQAIEYTKQALEATPHGHTHRAGYLKNLSLRIYSRFGRTEAIDDLHQAIEYTEQALAETPQAHPFRQPLLNGAAMLLLIRFSITRSATDIENSILLLEESWSFVSSTPSNRVQTAINLFQVFCLLSQCGDPYTSTANSLLQKSCSILDVAVLQLPRVSPRILARQDQQFNLLKFSRIAESAASCALMAGKDAAHALTMLELSRGIIMSFAIDCRGDLSELKIANPKMYDTFTDLRNLIDTPPLDPHNDLIDSTSGAGSFGKAEAHYRETTYAQQKREKAITEMEQTTAKIRELPGHGGFQLPAAPEQLMAMAKDGPIVVFISSFLRSDAIIVTSSAINSIMLPGLRYKDIPDRLEKITGLTKGKLRSYVARNRTMQEILCWLWDVAVEPVVRALGLTVKSAGDPDLAHIWWIGVGSLSMAPFHAAGNYSTSDSQHNILSYAISSYTPTIKALTYARERDVTLADGNPDSKLLLISMTETPGGGRLPDAAGEVNEIIELTNGSILTRHLDQPNAQTVLDQLKGGSFKAIHFACHGVTDDRDPSGSHLVLLKDGNADKLTVEDISGRSIGGAQLAYLSACSTAKNPELRLADETIHIASAFQLAGFNHVIATMWSSESLVCREISKDFYRSLFDGKLVGDGHRKIRIALHAAVERAQEKYPHSPLKWAPFIHMGA